MTDTCPAGQTTHLSDCSPHSLRPPRLATAINAQVVLPDRGPNGDGTASLTGAVSANHIMAILDWIAARMADDAGWDAIWDSPGGEHPFPAQLDAVGQAEEQWARRMDELFLGGAYGGPNIVAQLSSSHIFRRFALMNEPPAPKPVPGGTPKDSVGVDPPITPNLDPVYSLFTACQQLTTYGALGRGISLERDLNGTEIPASQTAAALNIFQKGPGRWYSPGSIEVLDENHKQAGAIPAEPITASEAHDATVASSKAGQYGPGSVYTYNPLAFTPYFETILPQEMLKVVDGVVQVDQNGNPLTNSVSLILAAEQQMLKEKKQLEDLQKQLDAVGGAFGLPAPQLDLPSVADGLAEQFDPVKAAQQLDSATDYWNVKVPTKYVQVGGSHVSMVLRRYTVGDKEVVQLFDTSAHTTPGIGATTADIERDYVMFKDVSAYRGIFGGEAYHSAPSGNTFAGMGTMPRIEPGTYPQVDAHLRRARPAGLARLVIIDQRQNPTKPKLDDILYVSRMIRMWNPDVPTRNYSISRLLYALRNTPYRESLRAYWIVYAPRGALSGGFFSDGARTRPFHELVPPGTTSTGSMMAAAVLSHSVDGSAKEIWRSKVGWGEGSPPKTVKQVFVDTHMPPVDWIWKKQAELLSAHNKAVAEKMKKAGELKSQYDAQVGTGDLEGAKATQAELLALIDEVPQATIDYQDWAADPYAADNLHPAVAVRDDPHAVYISSVVVGAVVEPGALQ